MKAKEKAKQKLKGLLFQELILKLMHFWGSEGCVSAPRLTALAMCSPRAAPLMAAMAKIPIDFTSISNIR